ncbi:hypothetical protein BDZ97DRAFT_1814275 [Flammula alnicola]|nr:hypothetical protein BDZ97DRAFT_1814275 [Flammula alnicola]
MVKGTKKAKAKPAHYRARHKNLGHLGIEDSDGRLQSRASEPVYCNVWNKDSDQTDSIEVTNENYRSAACKLEDRVRRAPHVSTPHASSSRPAPCPGLYSSSARRRGSPRSASRSEGVVRNQWQKMGRRSPKYSDSSVSASSHTFAAQDTYPPYQTSNPQVAHYVSEAEVMPIGFPTDEAFLTLAVEQSRQSNEDKAQPILLYSPPSLLPNNPPTEQNVPYYSHEFLIPRSLDLGGYQDICSGGQPDLHYATMSFMPEQTTTFYPPGLIPTEQHPLPPLVYHNLSPDFDSIIHRSHLAAVPGLIAEFPMEHINSESFKDRIHAEYF